MKRFLVALLMIAPALAFAARTTVTDNGNYLTVACTAGDGWYAVNDGAGGYDSGVVTLQYSTTTGWKAVDATQTHSTGDSGAIPFDLHGPATVRLNVASVAASSADIDLELVCGPR